MEFDDAVVDEALAVGSSQSSQRHRRVAELILSRNDEVVLEGFDKRCRDVNSGQAVLDYTRALFWSLMPLVEKDEFSRSAKLLVLVVVRVVELINEQKLGTEKKVLECLSFFAQEMSALPCRLLPSVVEAVVSNLETNGANDDGRSLDLLPNCLSMISSSITPVLVNGEQGDSLQISGREYKEHIVSRFLGIPWSKQLLTRMACMLRELLLNSEQIEDFLKKIFSHMKEVEPLDLPSLVYQLVLLASRGHKRAIINGIMSFFSKLQTSQLQAPAQNGSSGVDVYRQVEGTVILHINFAVKQDPALGIEWIAVARSNYGPLSSFTVAVLLSLARIQRFELQCFDILKAAAMKSFQDCERCRDSLWASAAIGVMCLKAAKDTELSFMRTVQSSAFGWDHIIPSVVQLGFIFIESGAGGRFLSAEDVSQSEGATDTQELGLKMLVVAFKVHEIAREEIIEQSKCRIIGLKSQQSALIIRMLAELVCKYPQLMLDHGSRLKESLDYFTFLPSNPASSIIRALCPLFQLSRDLQDYTILVLRKSMFCREASTRMIAVQGLLDLIIADKQARVNINNNSESESWLRMSMTEASSSQSGSQQVPRRGINGRNKNLLQELLGLLRRCLSQQVCVREILYRRLPGILLVDPASAEEVFDLVWSHFRHFYEEKEDGAVGLKLNDCVLVRNMNLHLEEPFDHLLACIHQLLTLQPQKVPGVDSSTAGDDFGFTFSEEQDRSQLSSGELLGAAFSKIRKGVQSSSLGDFKLDKSENFSIETVEGERKLEQGRLFLGVLEVLIDAAVFELIRADKESRQDEIKQEIKNYLALFDSLHQKVNQKQHVKASKHLFKAGPTTKPPSGRVRKPSEAGALAGNAGQGKQAKFAVPRAVLEKRVPLLSGSCIAFLLHTAAEQEDFTLLSFALSSCFRYLRGIVSASLQDTRASPELHCDDWKLLANPLFRVIISNKAETLTPHTPTENQQEKPKKGRKPSEDLAEGPLLNAVRSLDALCRTALQRDCLPEILRDISLDFNAETDDEPVDAANVRGFGTMDGLDAKLLHHWICNHIQPLILELLARSQLKETEVVAKLLLLLGRKLPTPMMKKHAVWATRLCKKKIKCNVAVASVLAALALSLKAPPDDLTLAKGFSTELVKVMGLEESQQESSLDFPFIDNSTRVPLAGLLLQNGERVLKDIEWLATKIKFLKPVRRNESRNTIAGFLAAPRRLQLEEVLYTRMEAVVLVLSDFCSMSLAGALAEHFLRFATHLYKCLAATTKMCIATKGHIQMLPTVRFQKLAEVTCTRLTAPLYMFMAAMQRDQYEKQSSSKIRREGRTIPNLIYYVEEYERYLIQLSRITKVNLMRHAKRSTARDFKIVDAEKKARAVAHRTMGAAQPAAEQEEEAEEEAVGEGEEGGEEIGEQPEEGEEEEQAEEGVIQIGVDGEETEENVAEDPEGAVGGAVGGDLDDNDDVVVESDQETVQAVVPSQASEGQRSSVFKRRSRVVESDDESDGEQPVTIQVSAKRQRSL